MPKYANELPHRRRTLCSDRSFVWCIEAEKLRRLIDYEYIDCIFFKSR
jgi:hypothetical protein